MSNEGAITVDGWRLWYGDDTTVDSRNASWDEAPSENVQALVVFYRETYTSWEEGELKTYPYRKLYCLQDYYWQFGAGSAPEAVGHEPLKFGKLLPDDKWWAIYDRAHGDMAL